VTRAWRWLLPLAAVPVLALLAYGFRLNPRDVKSPLLGRPAAPFTLTSFEGAPMELAGLRGKVVVLNFWASWCEPCKKEVPLLQEVWERHRDEGLVVLGIDARDFRSDARAFVEQYGLTYPIAYDGNGASLGRFGNTGFPETWFMGRDGRLVGEHIIGEFDLEQLEENVQVALETAR
jgi:cytochrome c biogenesis protein CcmG, thiol:disulfide interchange protein DsbE